MAHTVTIYKFKDIAKLDHHGELDIEQSRILVQNVLKTALANPDCSLLVDLRETTIKVNNLSYLMNIFVEVQKELSPIRNKIAALIPDDPERFKIANMLKNHLKPANIRYNYFIDINSAMEWVAEDVTVKII